MRTTPSDEALKELENQALTVVEVESGDQASDSLAAFGRSLRRVVRKKIIEVLDSEIERCNMRLPLTRSSG